MPSRPWCGCGPMRTCTTVGCSTWRRTSSNVDSCSNRTIHPMTPPHDSSFWKNLGVAERPRVSPARLVGVFVEAADTLGDEFDLIEFREMVSRHSTDLVEADATGLLLADGD